MKSEQEAVLKHFEGHAADPARFQPARDRAGERRFMREALNSLSEEERQTVLEVVGSAHKGNEEAKDALCEILEDKLKAPIKEALRRKGVACQDWDSGRHDLIVLVRERIEQLRAPENFFAWIFHGLQDVAKRHRPRYLKLFRWEHEAHEEPKQPDHCGRKWILAAGKLRRVNLFTTYLQKQMDVRQRFFEPLIDPDFADRSHPNHLNYVPRIDVWTAMGLLPERWARAMYLLHIEGYTAEEAGKTLHCSAKRVYRLVQKGKNRLRGLLAAYARPQKGNANLKTRSCMARRGTRTNRGALPVLNNASPLSARGPASLNC